MRTLRVLPALAVLVAFVPIPGAASAAQRNPYTAREVCGPGFGVIDRHPLYDVGHDGRSHHLAGIVLLYNASTGYNCAVTMKRRRIGKPDYVYVSLATRPAAPGNADGDSGSGLKYFAGPTYVPASQKCVQWHGGTKQRFRYQHATTWLDAAWKSRWSHCD
jgi:hypothetical protein